MNFIFSHSNDYTSKLVLEWVDYLGDEFVRINDERIDILDICINNQNFKYSFKLGNRKYENDASNAIWFRGGKVRISNNIYDASLFGRDLTTHKESAILFLSNYSHSKLEFLADEFSSSLGSNAIGRYNKLIALRNARKVGLQIPNTIATTSKKVLQAFFNQNLRIITKSLDLSFSTAKEIDENGNSISFMQYTKEFLQQDIEELPERFALTLFQALVPKSLEVRTFYLSGKCYSAAIFSQQNAKTEIDHRHYDYSKMNRIIPIQLPIALEQQIRSLMKLCKLNMGSFDFIRNVNGEFVFLEVNPIGQFGYISQVCNYKLHKKIAECIIQKSYKYK